MTPARREYALKRITRLKLKEARLIAHAAQQPSISTEVKKQLHSTRAARKRWEKELEHEQTQAD